MADVTETDEEAPGKSGMALGARALHLSGVQGGSKVASHGVQFAAMLAIATVLGPVDLGAFALLIFLASVVAQVLGVAVRPGMLLRTYGAAGDDDEGGDVDEDGTEVEMASSHPTRTLGTSLVLATVLSAIVVAATTALAEPIEELLLGDYPDGTVTMVAWAALLGGAMVMAKMVEMALWFEHRTRAFVLVETLRPTASLALLLVFLQLDLGVTGALAAMALGSAAAALLGLVLLIGSFSVCFDRKEAVEVLRIGREKAPVLMSMWFTQAADIFFVSRYVDPASVGVYNFGSRIGGASALLPRGFRLALRPLRKTALFPAAKAQYGREILDGLIFTYFMLLFITTVFVMLLLAPLVAELAPAGFEDIAPLIPLTAASMAMPSMLRTAYGSVAWRGKSHRSLVVAAVSSVAGFVALNILLGPEVGIYAPPIAALASFGVACTVLLVRGQWKGKAIDIHWFGILKALAFAVVIGAAYELVLPDGFWVELAAAAVAAVLYVALVIWFGAVPQQHRNAWLSIFRSGVRGGGSEDFDPRFGLTGLSRRERKFLYRALSSPIPVARLATDREMSGLEYRNLSLPVGVHLVSCLRRAAVSGGVAAADVAPGELAASGSGPVGESSADVAGGDPAGSAYARDILVAEFLFSNEPLAVRQATMRRALEAGETASSIHTLEDIAKTLRKVPEADWF